jgi:hypothetical protein
MSKFGRPKPLWITAMNCNTPISGYGAPELRQADSLVRFYALALAPNASRRFTNEVFM